MALLLRRLRHHFSRKTTSHPVPASRIDPHSPLLPPALCQRRFDIRTSERSDVLTFCSHSQLSRVFGRRGGEQSGRQLVMVPGGRLSCRNLPARLSIPLFNSSTTHRRVSRGTLFNPLIPRDGTRVKKHLSPAKATGAAGERSGERNESRN
ncbi:unnamed protein product [Coccothraustes coccothraustes]